jgi:AhpC/TSA family
MRFNGYVPWAVASVFGAIGAAVVRAGPEVAPFPSAGAQRGPSAHYVAPSQIVESNAMVRRVVDDLEGEAHDGGHLRWAQISGGLPVVIVFIKSGCPCSIEFEPYFHRVAASYRGAARFVGVIDAGLDAARRYATEQHVPYPILADANRTIIRRFGAKNGCYVALLSADGWIDGYWPGSSAEALHELGRRIAAMTHTSELALDVSGMPKALTTGCHYAP